MRELLLQIISGILGLFFASKYVSGFVFEGEIQILVGAGIALGLLNFFLKPVLKFITLPLWLLTFGLFSFIIDMGVIWLVDRVFVELKISGVLSLLWTTLWVLGMSFLVSLFFPLFSKTSK